MKSPAGLGRELARRLRGFRSSGAGMVPGIGLVAAFLSSVALAGAYEAHFLVVSGAAFALCAAFAVIFRVRPPGHRGRLVILKRRYREFTEIHSVRRLVLLAIGVSAVVLAAAFAVLG